MKHEQIRSKRQRDSGLKVTMGSHRSNAKINRTPLSIPTAETVDDEYSNDSGLYFKDRVQRKIKEFKLQIIEEEKPFNLQQNIMEKQINKEGDLFELGELLSSINTQEEVSAVFWSGKGEKGLTSWLITPNPSQPFFQTESFKFQSCQKQLKSQTSSYTAPIQYWFSSQSPHISHNKFCHPFLKKIYASKSSH